MLFFLCNFIANRRSNVLSTRLNRYYNTKKKKKKKKKSGLSF